MHVVSVPTVYKTEKEAMKKMMQRSLSCLLPLAMVVTLLMTSTLAAEQSVKITLEYPKDVPANDVVVTLSLIHI